MLILSLRGLYRPAGAARFFHNTSGWRHWLNYAAPAGAIAGQAWNKTGICLNNPNALAFRTSAAAQEGRVRSSLPPSQRPCRLLPDELTHVPPRSANHFQREMNKYRVNNGASANFALRIG